VCFLNGLFWHCAQVIGVVLADTHDHAMAAARRVKVTYEDLPVIMSIDDAVAAGSFFPAHHVLTTGAMEAEMAAAGLTVQGGGRIGGQEHFYLETQSTVAVPTEQGHLEIFSSTQDINETQKFCASVCAVAAAKIVVKCKRMGGGFGGKESRSAFVACAAALAASLLNRPVSINLDRDVDMSITGQRHAFQYNYKAGMDRDGRLRFLEVDLYSQGGCSHDLSVPVLDRALLHVDGVYKWPALTARGRVCRTNQPSHTAFRGFGGPQGMAITETVMQHLSEASGVPIDKLKTINMYRDGDKIPCGQVLKDFYLPSLWEKLHCIADVEARRNAVSEFNTANRWRKRGIAVTPTKFGINFEKKFLNQVSANVVFPHVCCAGCA
jgi:xanthine dehydrogenase/oxidase